MKVSAINLNNFKVQNTKANNQKTQNNLVYKQELLIPTTSQYLAFMGGYSIDLKETFKKLNDEQYPFDIREMIVKELEKGNPENKTLCDIHFEKYDGVLDCYSLDELKEKYPEFMNVQSSFEVLAKEDSFIGKFQQGENEIFATNEDLTLQLIKLYWGKGFSLNDLSNYVAKNSSDNKGINLYYAMTKLNIPLMDKRYANVLRLSNKEYNEKFTQEMSNRLKEAKEIKKQQQEGEPVYIPSGPLSEAHKQHISQGLKKYYQEHPEKIFELSKRQKVFYQEHPEKAQEMKEIMLYAWRETEEGKSVLKGLKRAMRKNNFDISPEELANLPEINNKKQEVLKEFWKVNKWACAKMSIAVKKGYANLEEIKAKSKEDKRPMAQKLGYVTIPQERYVFSNAPTKVRNWLTSWTKEQGLNPDNYVFALGVIYPKEQKLENPELAKKVDIESKALIDRFFAKQPNLDALIADAFQLGIVDILETLKDPSQKYKLPASLRKDMQKAMALAVIVEECTRNQPIYRKTSQGIFYTPGVEKEYLNQIQQDFIYYAVDMGCEDFIEYFQKTIDEKFEQRLKETGFKLK